MQLIAGRPPRMAPVALLLLAALLAGAILNTTLIVTLSFSLLAFSDFVPSVLFGLLTGLAMLLALLWDLTLLPAMLDRFVRSR